MKQILILGAGIGGLGTALGLAKTLHGSKEIGITLIDEENYHLFYANLYEVATSPEELTTLAQLKKSVALPIKEIIANQKINFIQGKVTKVDATSQTVFLGERKLFYDYLVLGFGSTNNFYGIEGAEKNAFTLQSVNGALRIRNRIEFLIQMHKLDVSKKSIRIAVAGGGFAGVEVAAELKGFLDFIAWENNFPREKLETLIIEGSGRLLPGLDDQVAIDVGGRLRELGVRAQTNSFITKVDEHFLEFKSGEKLNYDCLIWTAGVKANNLPFTPELALDHSQRMIVNSFLQVPKYPNIFALGDQACIMDKNNNPLPGTAAQAIDQAKYLCTALLQVVDNKTPKPFKPKNIGYIIPLGGKWMIAKSGPIYVKGFLGFIIRELVFLDYFASILGWTKALKLIYFENKLYSRNDD